MQIGFSTTNRFLSKVIRWITRSKVSHTWLLYYDDDFDCDMVMEATIEGFRLIPFESFKVKNIAIELFTPKHSLAAGFKAAGKKLGSKYDVKGLFGAIVPIIGKWFSRKWHNPFHSSKALFCSEAMVDVMKDSSYPGWESFEPEDINPQALRDFFAEEK